MPKYCSFRSWITSSNLPRSLCLRSPLEKGRFSDLLIVSSPPLPTIRPLKEWFLFFFFCTLCRPLFHLLPRLSRSVAAAAEQHSSQRKCPCKVWGNIRGNLKNNLFICPYNCKVKCRPTSKPAVSASCCSRSGRPQVTLDLDNGT